MYVYAEAHYPTLVANTESNVWLVMFSLDGILETAFPPDNPQSYLANPSFIYLGSVQELKL